MAGKIRYCGIPSCVNNLGTTRTDIPFFKMPHHTNFEVRREWDKAVRELYGINFMCSYLCGLHFRPDDYSNTGNVNPINCRSSFRLKKGALPCVPPPSNGTSNIQSELQSEPKEEPESEPNADVLLEVHYSEESEQNTFNFVDIESIKNGATQAKLQPNKCNELMDTNIDDNIDSMFTQCIQCKDYGTQLSELLVENSKMRKRFEDLWKENQSLKAQLGDNFSANIEKPKRSRCQVCNVFGMNDNHLCGNETEITCEYCSASFKTIIEFGTHLKESSHPKTVLYKCERCEKGYPSVILLKLHQESKFTHIVNTHTVESIIESPMDTSSMEQIFKCGMCDKSFEKPDKLKIHINVHKKQNKYMGLLGQYPKYECYICKMKLGSRTYLRIHMKKHVAARDKKCTVCDENLTLKELDEHLCHGKKSICCEYCNTTFSVTSKLLQHLDSHNDRIMSKCRNCPRFFSMNMFRLLHEKQHENEEPKSFICDICSKGFRSKHLLSSHLKRHETKRDYLCSECGRGFKNEKALMRHSRSHRDEKFKCPDCPFMCASRQSLVNHGELHLNVKYKCTECDALLSSKHGFRKHFATRHKAGGILKRFKCTFCPLKFQRSNKLNIHLRKHTGEKPFVCDKCPDKRYAYKQDYARHMETHLGKKSYQCNSCDQNFRAQWELNRHSLIHYKRDNDTMEVES